MAVVIVSLLVNEPLSKSSQIISFAKIIPTMLAVPSRKRSIQNPFCICFVAPFRSLFFIIFEIDGKIATYSLIAYLIVAISLFWRVGVYGLAVANMVSGFTTLILLIRAYGWDRFLSMVRLKWLVALIVYLIVLTIISITLDLWLWELLNS